MAACSSCKKLLPGDKLSQLPTCTACKGKLHFSCSCITSKVWSLYSQVVKEQWTCINCTTTLNKAKIITRSLSSENSAASSSATIGKSTPDTKHPKFEMNVTSDILREIIREEMQTLRHDIAGLSQSLNLKISTLEDENTKLKAQISSLQQYSRKNTAIISGLPKSKKEIPSEAVINLASKMNFKLQLSDIDACHRLPSNVNPQPMIIKFVSRIMKTNFIIHSRKMKPKANLVGGPDDKMIYVNEHLTAETVSFLKYTKEKIPSTNYAVTTQDCIVMAIQKDTKKKYKFKTKEQVDQFIAAL